MLAGAWDVKLDTQGRIMLPEYLRRFAGLKKHVVIAGLYSRLELWHEDAWHTYRQQTEAESDNIAESMSALDI
jgi:MraZ protein